MHQESQQKRYCSFRLAQKMDQKMSEKKVLLSFNYKRTSFSDIFRGAASQYLALPACLSVCLPVLQLASKTCDWSNQKLPASNLAKDCRPHIFLASKTSPLAGCEQLYSSGLSVYKFTLYRGWTKQLHNCSKQSVCSLSLNKEFNTIQ